MVDGRQGLAVAEPAGSATSYPMTRRIHFRFEQRWQQELFGAEGALVVHLK